MALVFGDRVYETSTTTGNGTLTLAGIGAANYRTFSAVIGDGNTCYYAIIHRNANEWEVGVGTVSAGALARTTVLKTSAGDTTKIVFSAGTKDVFNDMPAERIIALDAAGTGTTSLAGVAITAGAASFTTIAGSGDLNIGAGKFVVTAATGAVAFTGAVTGIITLAAAAGASADANTTVNGYTAQFGGNGGISIRYRGASAGIGGANYAGQIIANTIPLELYTIGANVLVLGANSTAALTIASTLAITLASSLSINGALSGVTTLTAVNSAAAQGSFSGWDETGAAGAGKGQVLIGSTATNQGRIHYDDAGQTVLYIDNSYDAAASTGIKLRVRTAGTPITAIAIDGSGSSTFGGLGLFPAGTTAIPSIRLPHGVAPSSPTDGDMWTTTAGLYIRINGSTVGPLS